MRSLTFRLDVLGFDFQFIVHWFQWNLHIQNDFVQISFPKKVSEPVGLGIHRENRKNCALMLKKKAKTCCPDFKTPNI